MHFDIRGTAGVSTTTFSNFDAVALDEMYYITLDELEQMRTYEESLYLFVVSSETDTYIFFSPDNVIYVTCGMDDLCSITLHESEDVYIYDVNAKEVYNEQTDEMFGVTDFLTNSPHEKINQTLFDYIDMI